MGEKEEVFSPSTVQATLSEPCPAIVLACAWCRPLPVVHHLPPPACRPATGGSVLGHTSLLYCYSCAPVLLMLATVDKEFQVLDFDHHRHHHQGPCVGGPAGPRAGTHLTAFQGATQSLSVARHTSEFELQSTVRASLLTNAD